MKIPEPQECLATFRIRITGSQHNTWQGELRWIDRNRSQKFRSVLELLRLMDEAVQYPEEKTN